MASSSGLKQWREGKAATVRTNQSATCTEPRPVAGLEDRAAGDAAQHSRSQEFGRKPSRSLSEISDHARRHTSELHNSRTPQHEKN